MLSFKMFITEKTDAKDWQKYLKSNSMLAAGVDVLKILTKGKYKAYIVGGTVRDIILGDNPHDVDIATNMPLEAIESLFKSHDIGKSKDFGIVTIKHKGHDFEVAQFREDGKYIDGRRPETVNIVSNFKDDANRRDFSINSMGIDKDGNIIDYFDGKRDIKNKVIRAVGNPLDRFKEDKLRMMRAARFAAKLDFDIDDDTKNAIIDQSGYIKDIAMERVRDELLKTAGYGGDKFAKMIEILDSVGILEIILPEIVQMKKFEHNPKHHPEGGVFDHVMAALKASKSKDPITNLSILLHDIGKNVTHSITDEGPRYLGHAKEGLDIIDTIADRLKLSNDDRDAVKFASLNHMKFHELTKMSNSKIIKLIRDKNFQILVDVAKADAEARGHLWNPDEWETILDKIEKVKNGMKPSEYDELKKLLNGNKIMNILNIKAGPKLGDIINNTLDWAIDNGVKDSKTLYKYIEDTYGE